VETNKDFVIKDNIKKISQLLNTIDDDLLSSNEISSKETGDYIAKTVMESSPGKISLRFDPLKMYLFMELSPPVNSDAEISFKDIRREINQLGEFCSNRVDWALVRELYLSSVREGAFIDGVRIAAGLEVQSHIPEYFRIKESLHSDFKPEVQDNKSVNYHHINSFPLVKKGEFLGDLIPEFPGVNGQNLLGEELKAPTQVVNNYKPGRNTTVHNGRLYSNIDGLFKIKDSEIEVYEILEIPSDVDYSTGDIDFNGAVSVSGSIREGFSVKSAGNLFVQDTIEPANIICHGDIESVHGIIGSEKYEIECDGSLKAVHIRNSRIKVKGSLYIKNGVINSDICSHDQLIIGKNSGIIGGTYKILKGVKVTTVGSDKGAETRIILGVDYIVEGNLKKINLYSNDIIKEMQNIQHSLGKCDNRLDREALRDLFNSLKEKLESLNRLSHSLLPKLDINDNSTLTVYGTVYPGTYIEICHIQLKLDRALTGVKFSLDKKRGCIKWEYLKR